jgi:hypothetical protein
VQHFFSLATSKAHFGAPAMLGESVVGPILANYALRFADGVTGPFSTSPSEGAISTKLALEFHQRNFCSIWAFLSHTKSPKLHDQANQTVVFYECLSRRSQFAGPSESTTRWE